MGQEDAKVRNALLMMLILAGGTAGAARNASINRCVTVHISSSHLIPSMVELSARETTSWLFDQLGITVRWKYSPLRDDDGKCVAMQLQFDRDSQSATEDALGYALPFQQGGTQIHVLLGNLSGMSNDTEKGVVLGYAMAHEIGHVLEAIAHHSESGVMKAHWTMRDISEMYWRRLRFDDGDAERIQAALLQPVASRRFAVR